MSNTTKKQSVLVYMPDLSSVLSTLADNIKRETDCISLVGTAENIVNIEKRDEFTNSDTTVALGDREFQKEVSNIAEHTCLSSAEAIYHAEELNCLTNEEASKMYQNIQPENLNLPPNYQSFKKRVKLRKAQYKLAKISYLLGLPPEKIKNVFQLKR